MVVALFVDVGCLTNFASPVFEVGRSSNPSSSEPSPYPRRRTGSVTRFVAATRANDLVAKSRRGFGVFDLIRYDNSDVGRNG